MSENQLTRELVQQFLGWCDKDEAGRHFTHRPGGEQLAMELEDAGLLEIHRPRHWPSGLQYGEEHWTTSMTQLGHEVYQEWWYNEGKYETN